MIYRGGPALMIGVHADILVHEVEMAVEVLSNRLPPYTLEIIVIFKDGVCSGGGCLLG
jgi:hypothetical protein